jgi:hypothetical protein
VVEAAEAAAALVGMEVEEVVPVDIEREHFQYLMDHIVLLEVVVVMEVQTQELEEVMEVILYLEP